MGKVMDTQKPSEPSYEKEPLACVTYLPIAFNPNPFSYARVCSDLVWETNPEPLSCIFKVKELDCAMNKTIIAVDCPCFKLLVRHSCTASYKKEASPESICFCKREWEIA